jgi:rare lipoprotein A
MTCLSTHIPRCKCLVIVLMACSVYAGMGGLAPLARATNTGPRELQSSQQTPDASKPPLDRSGRPRIGKASFYAQRFGGRKMADGTPMHLQGNNAASKTLPLGTTAMVTNLETGRSAIVTIRDRGPYVQGRIVDLSPSTAQKIGLEAHQGVAKVEVAPIAVPLGDGTVKLTDPVAQLKKDKRASDREGG